MLATPILALFVGLAVALYCFCAFCLVILGACLGFAWLVERPIQYSHWQFRLLRDRWELGWIRHRQHRWNQRVEDVN